PVGVPAGAAAVGGTLAGPRLVHSADPHRRRHQRPFPRLVRWTVRPGRAVVPVLPLRGSLPDARPGLRRLPVLARTPDHPGPAPPPAPAPPRPRRGPRRPRGSRRPPRRRCRPPTACRRPRPTAFSPPATTPPPASRATGTGGERVGIRDQESGSRDRGQGSGI